MIGLARRQGQYGTHGGSDPLLEQLFELLRADAMEEKLPAADAFCDQVQQFRSDTPGADPSTGSACVEACREYLAARRASVSERETGLHHLIEVLREALASVAADTGSFEADLLTASQRMTALTELEDLATLKQRLTQEVGQIKQAVVEKQQRDEALQAQLTKRITALETTLAVTRVAASLDPLTQVANRRQFDATLASWVKRKEGAGESLILALIDLDQFKTINDTMGHPAGDCVLVGTAQALTRLVRPCDLVARYGGDEFALLLVNLPLVQAEARLSHIVARLAETEFLYEKDGQQHRLRITISCGLAQCSRHDSPKRLIERADSALYSAKQQGRNRAVVHRTSRWLGMGR